MTLTRDELLLLIDLCGHRTVVPGTEDFPYDIIKRNPGGYNPDPKKGHLQAKLSMMLELAPK